MQRIRFAFLGIFVVVIVAWLVAHPQIFGLSEIFAMRHEWVLLTGLVAFTAMAIAVMLSTRPVTIEYPLGGLDKMYRLHKWLGITALAVGVLHWLWVKAPKWAVAWGWIVRPPRQRSTVEPAGLEAFFRGQRHLAEQLGEWALIAMVILVAIALLRRIPYSYFRQTHRLLAIVALVYCWHALVLTEHADWSRPAGWLTALLIAGCAVAAVIALFGRIGQRRRVPARIQALQSFPDNRVLSVLLHLRGYWQGHQPGQFALVTFDPREGPHPYTIASAWTNDGTLQFMIKASGDYTATLPSTLRRGLHATVEGPYGTFRFDGPQHRQIWIGAGIGITPFIARLGALAAPPDQGSHEVDLFYVTQLPDEQFFARLQRQAEAAGVTLHIHVSGRDPRLTGEVVREKLPDWNTASIWFCGPVAMGDTLEANMQRWGLPAGAFHRELFQMR